jgi:DNA invertase Pin-like site-specific DNA recombinase
LIAQRTKDALQAAKARGVVLGNPNLADVRDRAVASVKADADRFAKNVAPIIREIQSRAIMTIAEYVAATALIALIVWAVLGLLMQES